MSDLLQHNGVYFALVFVAVLVVIGVIAWLLRRFGSERFGGTAGRNRQPRLAVIDAASVDGRRRLVIIRRDNVEHLLMIGGPTDVVVETNIVRGNAAAAAREAAPARAAAVSDSLPRPVPLGDAAQWSQPEPSVRIEPSVRPQRAPVAEDHWSVQQEQPVRPAREPRITAVEDDTHWPLQPQIEPAPRPQRQASALSDFSAERSLPEEITPAVSRPKPTPSVAPPAEPDNADQNLGEMANRLEAALRRPVAAGDTRPAATPKPAATEASTRIAPELRVRKEPAETRATAAETTRATPAAEFKAERAERAEPKAGLTRTASVEVKPATEAKPASAEVKAEPKPGRVESKFGPPKPAAQQPKTLYDSLEQEMASLLGRPASGKG